MTNRIVAYTSTDTKTPPRFFGLSRPATYFFCSSCRQIKPMRQDGGTGYAVTFDGVLHCYACCAVTDRSRMCAGERTVLYLVKRIVGGAPLWFVENWPGTLSFRATDPVRFNHPFSPQAQIVYFTGPDKARWSARNIGDSQIAHCRRLK